MLSSCGPRNFSPLCVASSTRTFGSAASDIGDQLDVWRMATEVHRAVSVAMATYNGARFVAEQLRSILVQQPAPDEVVVSDDASSDDTVEVVRAEFERSAQPGTRLIALENAQPLGVASRLRAGR